jgi:hypothetical protein
MPAVIVVPVFLVTVTVTAVTVAASPDRSGPRHTRGKYRGGDGAGFEQSVHAVTLYRCFQPFLTPMPA